jgi:anti-sigma regulatory factor (Ser/Thr protein kinase)/ActR/RegA family two-component response regulator
MELSEKHQALAERLGRLTDARALLIGNPGEMEGSLEEALASFHCGFARAAGSADAIRQLRHTPYAVVITDPATSIQEDLALVGEIQHTRPGVRVIILAQRGTPEELISALRQRVFLCQCAPFNAREIARYAVSAVEAGKTPDGIEVLSANRSWISVQMNCDLMNADRLTAFFHQFRRSLPDPAPEEMMIAFQEVLQNAIEHGAGNDPSKLVKVAAVRTARTFVFYVSDPGKGFTRDDLPHAAISYGPEEAARHFEVRERAGMRPGGYGILLASGIVDEMIYSDKGNEVLLIKYLKDSENQWPILPVS